MGEQTTPYGQKTVCHQETKGDFFRVKSVQLFEAVLGNALFLHLLCCLDKRRLFKVLKRNASVRTKGYPIRFPEFKRQ